MDPFTIAALVGMTGSIVASMTAPKTPRERKTEQEKYFEWRVKHAEERLTAKNNAIALASMATGQPKEYFDYGGTGYRDLYQIEREVKGKSPETVYAPETATGRHTTEAQRSYLTNIQEENEEALRAAAEQRAKRRAEAKERETLAATAKQLQVKHQEANIEAQRRVEKELSRPIGAQGTAPTLSKGGMKERAAKFNKENPPSETAVWDEVNLRWVEPGKGR